MARGRRHRPARRHRGPLSGRLGYAAFGTGVAAIAGGVIAALGHHTSPARPVASACGLVTCTAAAPSPSAVIASIEASPSPSRHRARAKPPARHRPKPHPRPGKTPHTPASPAAPAPQPASPPPTITVTYTLAAKGSGSIQGEFTITNHGSSSLNGWQLTATIPGDRFTSAWGSGFQFSGDTITYSQALLQGGIAPGSSLTVGFDADGTATSPSACSIDGSACVS